MPLKIYNACSSSNSARSIMAEVILNHLGRDRFKAYSAGSHPRGEVHPLTLEVLAGQHYDVRVLRSKLDGVCGAGCAVDGFHFHSQQRAESR